MPENTAHSLSTSNAFFLAAQLGFTAPQSRTTGVVTASIPRSALPASPPRPSSPVLNRSPSSAIFFSLSNHQSSAPDPLIPDDHLSLEMNAIAGALRERRCWNHQLFCCNRRQARRREPRGPRATTMAARGVATATPRELQMAVPSATTMESKSYIQSGGLLEPTGGDAGTSFGRELQTLSGEAGTSVVGSCNRWLELLEPVGKNVETDNHRSCTRATTVTFLLQPSSDFATTGEEICYIYHKQSCMVPRPADFFLLELATSGAATRQ